MISNRGRYLIVILLVFWITLLQSDGFAELTMVRTQQGYKPIELFRIGDYAVLVADGGQLKPYSITHTMSYVADCFIKIQIKDICVCAAPNQKFFSCTRNEWVSANALKISEQLLCGSGKTIEVSAVETVHKRQRMHTFSVQTSHVYCVTPYEIIAHNIDPVCTVPLIALSAACPPAAAVVAAPVAVCSLLSCIMFCLHKRSQRNTVNNNGCFSPDIQLQQSKMPNVKGCYHSVPECPVVCDIKVGKETEITKITPYINPEAGKDDIKYVFPIAEQEKITSHHMAQTQNDCDESKRYAGPWYNRTEDWIKEYPFGQKIKKSLERSGYINQGKRAFEVLENVEGCNGFQKGDYVVIDAMHKDHLEVFGKDRKWKNVANFDGTFNTEKTKQGSNDARQPLVRG